MVGDGKDTLNTTTADVSTGESRLCQDRWSRSVRVRVERTASDLVGDGVNVNAQPRAVYRLPPLLFECRVWWMRNQHVNCLTRCVWKA